MNGVYWIYGPSPEPGVATQFAPLPVAVVLCPRGGRDLLKEMQHLRRSGVDTVVSLLSYEQIDMLELEQEGPLARRAGMQFLHHPIPDHELPPDPQAFIDFVEELAQRARNGERLGIHCWGSIGRATVTATCTLIHLGWTPAEALAAVETARGCPVPDTDEQELWILNYKAQA